MLAHITSVDWRGIRAHLDWRLLKVRSRWLWLAGCALAFLSMLGSWTLPWNSTVQVGSYYTSDYVYTYYNNDSGENAFHTLAWLLLLPAIAAAVAYAALKPWPDGPAWLRLVPRVVLGVLGGCVLVWGVKAMFDANELIQDYYATNTSFPGGVGFMLVAVIVLFFGGRKLRRTREAEAGLATPPPAPPAPPVAPPAAPAPPPSA